jgi:hypothetical protein
MGIVTMLGVYDPVFEFVEEQGMFSYPERPDPLCNSPSPLFNGYRRYFPGLKRPGREVGHAPPSTADV